MMTKKNGAVLVIVDPNESSRDYLRLLSLQRGFLPFCFDRETICLDNLPALDPALVILGSLPLEGASRMIHAVKVAETPPPMVVISNGASSFEALALNGFEDVRVLPPGFKTETFFDVIQTLLASKTAGGAPVTAPQVVGNSTPMLRVKRMISNLGRSDGAILIRGGPGTGKELVARAVHHQSARVHNPFIKIDCRLISGHPPALVSPNGNGAVQGNGIQSIAGIRHANHGTLFLKEVGATPPDLQNALLLILEEGAVSNPESRLLKKADIRILASTSLDLARLVQDGRFRKDLFFRLNVFTIDLPKLNARKEDISILMDFFADAYCTEKGISHFDIGPEGKRAFERYPWPGNVRELRERVFRVLSDASRQWKIDGIHQNQPISSLRMLGTEAVSIDEYADFSEVQNYIRDIHSISLKEICSEFVLKVEKRLMQTVLEYTQWNRKKAAAMLDISYKSLLNKIKEYHLT